MILEPREELRNEVTSVMVKSMGKPFAPDVVIFVPDLPRNRAVNRKT